MSEKYWERQDYPKDTCGMDHYSDPDHCLTYCERQHNWWMNALAKAEQEAAALRKERDEAIAIGKKIVEDHNDDRKFLNEQTRRIAAEAEAAALRKELDIRTCNYDHQRERADHFEQEAADVIDFLKKRQSKEAKEESRL